MLICLRNSFAHRLNFVTNQRVKFFTTKPDLMRLNALLQP